MLTLADVRRLALALPDATEAPHFKYTSFRVRGKIFATAPPDGTALHVFVGEEARAQALALQPAAVEKLEWGGKVVGLRVLLARAEAALVGSLLRHAWTCKAPKALSKPAPAPAASTRRKR
jgi:hypothetical protein